MGEGLQSRFTRRSFLKGLGALALSALPACRRAQQYAVQVEESPEWQLPGEAVYFAGAMPWASGAVPLLAVCCGGLPVALQPNPAYTARAGLPALAQASLLDLYSPERLRQASLGGRPLPWQGLQGSFRAWARALRAGRRVGFLFPSGYSAVRAAQVRELLALPEVSCYAWDPVAEPRSAVFGALAEMQRAALGEAVAFPTGFGSLAQLTEQLPQLDVLFIFTPADPAALDADFARALAASHAETVRFSLRPPDETARRCLCHVPLTHFLEEWGAEADAHGQLCLRQPITRPLVPAVSEAEALHALLHDGELAAPSGEEPSVALRWLEQVCPHAKEALKKGFTTTTEATTPLPAPTPLPPAAEPRPYLHPLFVDGRFLHNAWLREAYDPISGAAGAPALYLPGERWESAGAVQLGRYTLPAVRVPGLAQPLLPMLPGVGAHTPWRAVAAEFPARPLRSLPPETQPAPRPPEGDSWGLIIDASACVGCNACTIACRAENNVPTVGAEEQLRGRDIQWLRIDRYLDGGDKLHFVPAMCRQCRNAPCEAVCPVNATVHTSDGLNAMVYPRCWGTRYCAAACPYQARTFNFHDYARASRARTALPPNPQVTLRSRGVMEKCSCCVQRIQAAKQSPGGEPPRTACQLACPRGAIRLVNWATSPPPSHATSRFDSPGTHPATLYTWNNS